MKIVIGCDHGGLDHKNAIAEHLKERGFEVVDCGIYEQKSVDYPDIAKVVCEKITSGDCERGILVCGTGIGMSMAANKIKGITIFLLNIPVFITTPTFFALAEESLVSVWPSNLVISLWIPSLKEEDTLQELQKSKR